MILPTAVMSLANYRGTNAKAGGFGKTPTTTGLTGGWSEPITYQQTLK